MGFKSGGDNKETLTIQAADGEQTKLILKSTEECFIRLESDTNNDVESQNPYIEFVQDGGATDFTIGLNSTGKNPENVTISHGADNAFLVGSNLAQDTPNAGHIQFYCRTTASVGFYDRGSTNHGTPDREGLRVGIGPVFSESNFPQARLEVHNAEDAPCPALALTVSGSAQRALKIVAANTATDIIEITGSALSTGAAFSAQLGANGSAIALKARHVTGTRTTATTTDVANAIPANASIIAIAIRVTTGYDAHITKIGVVQDDDFFVGADPTGGTGTNVLKNNVLEQAGDTIVVPTQVANNNFIANTSDQTIRLTHGSSAGGAVRMTVYYYEITAPTS